MKDLCLETYKAKIEPLIFWENHRQLEKWGIQNHDAMTWFVILGEECGELAQAILEEKFGKDSAEGIVKEAIQVATLAIKIAEMFRAEIDDTDATAEEMCREILD